MLTIFGKEYVSFYIWFCKEKRAVISLPLSRNLVPHGITGRQAGDYGSWSVANHVTIISAYYSDQ